MKKTKTYKVIGIMALCINAFILLNSISLYYFYNFTDKLYMFMYPNYILLINTLIGIIGISISVMLYKKIVGIRLFSIVTAILWLATFSNYFFPVP
jgi:hypothetical protein